MELGDNPIEMWRALPPCEPLDEAGAVDGGKASNHRSLGDSIHLITFPPVSVYEERRTTGIGTSKKKRVPFAEPDILEFHSGLLPKEATNRHVLESLRFLFFCFVFSLLFTFGDFPWTPSVLNKLAMPYYI